MAISTLLRMQVHQALEAYLEIRSLASLKSGISQEELSTLRLPTGETDRDKEEAIDKIIRHFLDNKFSQKAYTFLSFFYFLREDVKAGPPLHSTLNNCYQTLKDEILLTKILSLYEENPAFYISVNGERLADEDVKELAKPLSENKHMRVQLSSSLGLTAVTESESHSGISDVDDWSPIVKDVIQILKTCFERRVDIESETIKILERDNYANTDWMSFYRYIVCEKLAHKRITNTMLARLKEILGKIKLPEQNLQEAYTASLSAPLLSDVMPNLSTMVEILAENEMKFDSIPIIEFVEYLIYDIENTDQMDVFKELMHWNMKMAYLFGHNENWLEKLREQVRAKTKHSMYLLISVKSQDAQSKFKSKKKQKFLIRAWLVDDEHKEIDRSDPSEEAVLFADIPQHIDVIRAKFRRYLAKIDMVDLFLEHPFLSNDIYSWEIKKGVGKVQFIAERAWVIRFLERTEKNVYQETQKDWTERWESFQNYGKNCDTCKRFVSSGKNCDTCELVHMFAKGDCTDKNAFFRMLMSLPAIFCVALDFVPSDPGTPLHIFTNMINAGIPIVFWRKQETNTTATSFSKSFPAWLKELINKELIHKEENGRTSTKNLKDLPNLIWQKRLDSKNEDFYHLILLWDDPYRLPPQLSFDQTGDMS